MIFTQSPYIVQLASIKGLWQLRGKKVFAFSATSSMSHERMVNNVVTTPKILKFRSEYELVHGVSPISDPQVVTFESSEKLRDSLFADIEKFYEHGPVIVICNDDQAPSVVDHLRSSRLKFVQGGSQEVLR